jgi:hypothetical protein
VVIDILAVALCVSDFWEYFVDHSVKSKQRNRRKDNNSDFKLVEKIGQEWRQSFNADDLEIGYWALFNRNMQYAKSLLRLEHQSNPLFDSAAVTSVFGADSKYHAFAAPRLLWNVTLTEPMATRTLAGFLATGPIHIRAARIRAFLLSLGLSEDDLIGDLGRSRATAEEGRIDLKIVWPDDENGSQRVVIVEAKFGHKITKGQLSKYLKATRRLHGNPDHCILLTLDDAALRDLHWTQIDLWKNVFWRDLWLRFERLRPIEENPGLQIFMGALWNRIGGLTLENRHGQL